MARGRKSKYDPDTFPILVEGYAREGLTEVQIAAKLGVGVSTFSKYKVDFVEFSEALKRGKAPVDTRVENSLPMKVEEIITVKHIAPDTTAQIFWLTNRRPDTWRHKQSIDHTTKGEPVQPTTIIHLGSGIAPTDDPRYNGENESDAGE